MQQDTKAKRKRRTAKSAKISTGRKAAKQKSKRLMVPLGVALEFYRPLKKPVTLRLDADVLAWFKRDGKRYQTRINSALRKVMAREMKNG